MTETPPQTPPPPGPPPPQGPAQGWNTDHLKDYRLLRRSRTDRKVAGVAGGLGRHLDVDPTVLRVLFVVLVFFGGAGLLMYGALWLLVPEEGTGDAVVRTSDSTRNTVLIVVAVIAGLAAIGDMWNGYGFPWPIAVAGLVVAVVLLARDRSSATPPTGSPPPGTPTGAWPGAGAPPPYVGAMPAGPDDGTGQTQVLPPFPAQPPQGPPPAWYPPVPPPPARPQRRTGPLLFGFTLAMVALALGVLGLWDAGGNSVDDAAYPALALAVIGAMLVVGAFVGRAGGLIALGVIASLALGGAALSEPTFEGDRDLVARPTSAADLADAYRVPAGRIELDLTGMDADELDGRSVALDVNAGEIVVVVPDDVDVAFDARIDFGGLIETPDGNHDGWGPHLNGELEAASESRADLELDIDLNMGHIELRQS